MLDLNPCDIIAPQSMRFKKVADWSVVALQESTPLFRKFLGPLDVLWSALSCLLRRRAICCVHSGPQLGWRAMQAHHSQFVWWRRLYVVFSRYMYLNTLSGPHPL